MSRCSEIDAYSHHDLRCLESELTGDETVRTLYVSDDIWRVIQPPYSDDADGEKHAQFRATLDAFLEGAEFTVAKDPYSKPSDAMIARVDPVDKEIWDIRSIAPHPGIRALGAFWCQDTFVALTWNYRENYENAETWKQEIKHCIQTWQRLFGSKPPLKGRSLDEYLTCYFAV